MLGVEIKVSKSSKLTNITKSTLLDNLNNAVLKEGNKTWIFKDPVAKLVGKARLTNKHLLLEGLSGTLELSNKQLTVSPFELLNELFEISSNLSIPLTAGYFSYELLHCLEKVKQTTHPESRVVPELLFFLYNKLILIQNLLGNQNITEYELSWNLNGDCLLELPKEVIKIKLESCKTNSDLVSSSFTQSDYELCVERIKEEILKGDYYQVNLSRQLHYKFGRYPSEIILKALQSRRGGVLGFKYQNKKYQIISVSPELFFKSSNQKIYCEPIKGTISKNNNGHDLRLDLINSVKDTAELNMIVDLIRNDLNKVSDVGSVKLIKHRLVTELPNLLHTSSLIEATLKPNITLEDLIKALFPCGSITGAPKIASMAAISKFENGYPRGIYCGAIGYIGSNKLTHFNVAIRSCLLSIDDSSFSLKTSSGGGVTLMSNGADEYQETETKLKELIKST